jgi:hypothetical protein
MVTDEAPISGDPRRAFLTGCDTPNHNAHFPPGGASNCHRHEYDYTRPGMVERTDARHLLARLRRDGIEVEVLERCGLENYFPRHAREAVMGRDLSAHFPLDPRRPVTDQVPGYNKNMNRRPGEAHHA